MFNRLQGHFISAAIPQQFHTCGLKYVRDSFHPDQTCQICASYVKGH